MQIYIYKIIGNNVMTWWKQSKVQNIMINYDQYDSHLYNILYKHLCIYMRSERHYHWDISKS